MASTEEKKLKPTGAQTSPSKIADPAGKKGPVAFNEQTNYVPKTKIITIFLACASVDLLALMDQTTLAASLTIIARALNASSQIAWISGAYFVTSTSFQLLYGRLSDVWSRKVVLLGGLAIFFAGSLAASLAQTAVELIVFRAITGVGGGGLMTIAQTIVSDVVTLRERGKYQGILGAVVALANGIGPIVGAALASQSRNSWSFTRRSQTESGLTGDRRWIFRLNLPLSVFTSMWVIFFMPLKKVQGYWKTKLQAIDWFGAFLALGGSALLVLALTWAGGAYPWVSAHVIATLVVGLVVCVGFVFWQWKCPCTPLIPLHIFKNGLVDGACMTMFINGWNFLVQIYYIPTFYQLVYGYSAMRSGLLLLPITLTQTVSSTCSGLIVNWLGRYRESLILGWIVWAIGLGLFSTLNESSSLGRQIGYALLTGFGVGQTLQPSLIAAQAGVERKDMAVVTGTRNFVRNLGGTLGLAIAGSVINNSIRSSLSSFGLSEPDLLSLINQPDQLLGSSLVNDEAEKIRTELIVAYRQGFRRVFLIGAGLAAAATLIVIFLMPQVSLDRPDDEKLKEEGIKADEESKVSSAAVQ